MSTTKERIRRARSGIAATMVAVFLLLGAVFVTAFAQPAIAASSSALPACPFWTNATPPARTVSPWIPPLQTAQPVNLTSRLPVPTGITGTLSGGQVSVTFNQVPGAQSYRLWRNGQPIAWTIGYAQPTITIVDTTPCKNAYYSVIALADQSATDASTGQLSPPYQLNADGSVVLVATAVGSTISMMVTSYNDVGLTASGYNAQLGICAVDPRVIPWGTYFTVPGYGTCYAADIGTWIQNDTVDVWLPGSQADNWGVQDRTITIIANPYTTGPTTPPTPTPTPTRASPSPSASTHPSTPPPATSPPPGSGKAYEANTATLGGGATANSCSVCLDGQKVSSIGGSGKGTVTFTEITEPSTGSYTLTVSYLSVGKARSAIVTVNGVAQTVAFAETSPSSYGIIGTAKVTVRLNTGSSNTIEFSGSGSSGAPDLDHIVV